MSSSFNGRYSTLIPSGKISTVRGRRAVGEEGSAFSHASERIMGMTMNTMASATTSHRQSEVTIPTARGIATGIPQSKGCFDTMLLARIDAMRDGAMEYGLDLVS